MNLGDIRTRIANEMRWNPANADYRADISQVVNDVYQQLLISKPWTFMEAVYNLLTRADVPLVGTWLAGLQAMTVTTGTVATWWPGSMLLAPDGNLYEVLAVNTGTGVVVFAPAYAGGNAVAAACTLQTLRYWLPQDVTDVLGIMSRVDQRGQIELVDRSSEADLMLNDTDPGAPAAFILDQSTLDRPPRTLTFVTALSAGKVAPGFYRYMFVYTGGGRSTAPSPIVEVTLAASSIVTLTMETKVGFAVAIYREDNKSGAFRLLATAAALTATYADDASATPNEDIVYEDVSEWRSARFWPRPDAGYTLELRYLRRAPRMRYDNDSPQLPQEYHRILVHLALVELMTRHALTGQADVQRELANEMRGRLENRYLTMAARKYVRRMWGTTFYPSIRPTVTYQG